MIEGVNSQMRLKKILTILLTIAMVVSLLPATAFAANNTATTMRLAKTQGTVKVTNSTGKEVKQTGNMKLYNGYKVKTGAKSYVWISLDDTKVAKLDANSVMEVQKKGKSLTLYLSSGNMFFNVKDPLKSGESFSIKTSTMTTGIRGTSGCVRVISDRVTEIHLLTGQVMVYTEHPALGVSKSALLQAGQKATSLIDWEAEAISGEMAEIVIERLENHEVCGICSKEIAEDPELLERIEREAPHLLPEKAAAEADERLAADEAKAEEKQEEIDQKVEEQTFPEDVDPYFEEEPSSGGGGGGGSAAIVDTNVVTTWQQLVDKITQFNQGTEDMTITLGANLPEADAVDVEALPEIGVKPDTQEANGATLTLNLQDYALDLPATLVNEVNLNITNIEGFISLSGGGTVIDNRGTLTMSDGTIVMGGDQVDIGVVNSGILYMAGGDIGVGELELNDSGKYEFIPYDVDTAEYTAFGTGISNTGTVTMTAGSVRAASGILDSSSPVSSENAVTVSGGTIESFYGSDAMTISGNASISGSAAVMGKCTNSSGSKLTISGGAINSSGIGVENYGTLEMSEGTISTPGPDDDMTAEVVQAISNEGTANIAGGTIHVQAPSGVGIANVKNTSSLTLGDSAIINVTGNSATGISVESGEAIISGGTINVKETDDARGMTGVRVIRGADLVMNNGSIIVTSADDPFDLAYPYGIYSEGNVKLAGGSVTAAGTRAHALYVPAKGNIVDGTLGTTLTATELANVMGDIRPDGYRIIQQDGVYTPEGAASGYTVSTKADWDAVIADMQKTSISNGTAAATITLGADFVMTDENDTNGTAADLSIAKGLDVTLDLAGFNLIVKEPVEVKGALTINGVGKFNTTQTTGETIANVIVDGGTFEMDTDNPDDLVLNTANVSGAEGIIVKNKGTCILKDYVFINVNAPQGKGIHNIDGTVDLAGVGAASRTEITVSAADAYGIYNENEGTLRSNLAYINLKGANSTGIWNGTKDLVLAVMEINLDADGTVGIRSTGGLDIPRHNFTVTRGAVAVELLGGQSRIGNVNSETDTNEIKGLTRFSIDGATTGVHLKNNAKLILETEMQLENNRSVGVKVDSGATLQAGEGDGRCTISFNNNSTNPVSGNCIESAGTLLLDNAILSTYTNTALTLTGGTAQFNTAAISADKNGSVAGTAIDMTPADESAPVQIIGAMDRLHAYAEAKDKVAVNLNKAITTGNYKVSESDHSGYYRLMKVYEIDSVATLNDVLSKLYKNNISSSLKLTADITALQALRPQVNGSTTIELDLNGHDLDLGIYTFYIYTNLPDFMLVDTGDGTGTITGKFETMIDIPYVHLHGGKMIVPANAVGIDADKVFMHGGTLEVNGGKGINAVNTNAEVKLLGGTVTVNSGTGVYGYSSNGTSNPTKILVGGAAVNAVGGTGIYNDSGATLMITSGTIKGGDGTTYYAVYNAGTIASIEDGVIDSNAKTFGLETVSIEEPTESEEETLEPTE